MASWFPIGHRRMQKERFAELNTIIILALRYEPSSMDLDNGVKCL